MVPDRPPAAPRPWRRVPAFAGRLGLSTPALLAVALLHLLPFAARPALIGGDEPHYALLAHSLATDLDVDLTDDYEAVAGGAAAAGSKRAGQALDRHVVRSNGRELPAHPLGLPVLAAPLLAAQELVAPGAPPDLLLGLLTLTVTFAGLLAGCSLLGRWLSSPREGTLLGLMLYFGSPLWYYSRTFFTEPYTWAWAVLGVGAVRRGWWLPAAVALGLALAMKETAVLLVAPILLVTWRLLGARTAALVAAGPAVFGALWVAKNLRLAGEPIATFQPFQVGEPVAGLAGLLFDPSHGLLWFAPLLVVAAAGWGLRSGSRPGAWLHAGSLLAFLGYLAVTAAWVDWRGGSSYATRLLLPALPALAIPAARLWSALAGPSRALVLGVPFALGFGVQLAAAVDPVPALWGPSAGAQIAGQPLAFGIGVVLAGAWGWRALR